MNERLLVNQIVNIQSQYIYFLNFIHPHYNVVKDLSDYDNPYPTGIIYHGSYSDEIKSELNNITHNWIIVNNNQYDLDLTTNEGLIKNLLPIHYINIRNSLKHGEHPVYNNISYDDLLSEVKIRLIDNSKFEFQEQDDSSPYGLFMAILGTPDVLNYQYFTLVNKDNIRSITSSVLTFLSKVQSQNIFNASPNYARLIIQSNKRYGKHIRQGINKYIHSKCKPEISLYNLLTFLNRAR